MPLTHPHVQQPGSGLVAHGLPNHRISPTPSGIPGTPYDITGHRIQDKRCPWWLASAGDARMWEEPEIQ